jgi:hypothetical protein
MFSDRTNVVYNLLTQIPLKASKSGYIEKLIDSLISNPQQTDYYIEKCHTLISSCNIIMYILWYLYYAKSFHMLNYQ